MPLFQVHTHKAYFCTWEFKVRIERILVQLKLYNHFGVVSEFCTFHDYRAPQFWNGDLKGPLSFMTRFSSVMN